MQTITTTIKREFLKAIVSGEKRIEYRELKPYWTRRLAPLEVPFRLRLINGMQRRAPEVTVVIGRIKKDVRNRQYELHITRVAEVHNWDRRRSLPPRA